MNDEFDRQLAAHWSRRNRALRAPRIGFGLLASLVVGFAPLSDALLGHGSFEGAMLRFLAGVAFCVGAAALLGRVIESAPPPGLGSPSAGLSNGDPGTALVPLDDAGPN